MLLLFCFVLESITRVTLLDTVPYYCNDPDVSSHVLEKSEHTTNCGCRGLQQMNSVMIAVIGIIEVWV